MSFEVDILPVGDLSKSGDAIAFRYGVFGIGRGGFRVVVIDGGFEASGEALCDHIHYWYGTDYIDLVIASHPDADHVSGLSVVLEEMRVGLLWMHRPWIRDAGLSTHVFKRSGSLPEPLRKSLDQAYELEKIAVRKKIPIDEPFAGLVTIDGRLLVLGPTADFYNALIPSFAPSTARRLFEKAALVARGAKGRVTESIDSEALVEPPPDAPGARNNSSVILRADFDEEVVLFTADAGLAALQPALDYAAAMQLQPASIVQLPHHGSKRNVGPAMLDRLIGLVGGPPHAEVFVSVARNGAPKHPSQRLVNAVVRRRGQLCRTRGSTLCYKSIDVPTRPGWTTAPVAGFVSDYVEEED